MAARVLALDVSQNAQGLEWDGDNIGAVDYTAHTLLVGASHGRIIVASNADPGTYPPKVLETRKLRPVTGFVSLPQVKTVIVFTEGGAATGYTLPNLDIASGMAMRDVHGGSALDHNRLAVFSPGAIRILEVSTSGLRLKRTVDLRGACSACRLETGQLVVGSSAGYSAVEESGEIKFLAPCGVDTVPMVAPVGIDQVLLVQGTGSKDPATGIVLTTKGEIREGAVIVWEQYPSSIVVSSGRVFACVSGKLVIHDLSSAKEVIVQDPQNADRVALFTEKWSTSSKDLEDRLGVTSRIESDVAIMSGPQIWVWYPEPRLLVLERAVLNGVISEIVPDPMTISTEQGVMELEYLSLLLALHTLHAYNGLQKAERAWLGGPRLDYHLVLYIYELQDEEPSLFLGLRPLLKELRDNPTKPPTEFLHLYLKTEYKRRRSPADLFVPYCRIVDDDEFARMALTAPRERAKVLAEAEAQGRWGVLEHVYSLAGQSRELVNVWLRLLNDETERVLPLLQSHLQKSRDSSLVWDSGFELLRRGFGKTALEIFKHKSVELDDSVFLDTLKETNNDAWRDYLHYLASENSSRYVADLAMLVVADLLGCVDTSQFDSLYSEYKRISWPKADAVTWIGLRLAENGSETTIAALEELWVLIRRNDVDTTSLMTSLDQKLPCLRIERAALYAKLGLHAQAIEMLSETGDFRSLLYYRDYGRPLGPQEPPGQVAEKSIREDLAKLIFNTAVVTGHTDPAPLPVIRDVLHDSPLDLMYVIERAPSGLPASAVSDFVAMKLRERAVQVRRSALRHSLVKSEAQKKYV